MKYYVGIEGFCTRYSVAVLSDAQGTLLAAYRQPETLNLHTIRPEVLANRLKELLRNLYLLAGLEVHEELSATHVCIGMSGVGYSYDRSVVLPRLVEQELGWKFGVLACTGDAEIVLASHALQTRGSLILSHTGSVAYATGIAAGELKHYRFGGWGPEIGDEGSGFWIGREALRSICLEHARHDEPSLLWRRVKIWLESPTPETSNWDRASELWHDVAGTFDDQTREHPRMDPRTLVYRFAHRLALEARDDGFRHAIAGLVVPVMNAFRDGDPTARAIATRAMEHLANQHRAVCELAHQRRGFSDFSPLVLYGGVLNHNRELVALLKQAVAAKFENAQPALRLELAPEGSKAMRPALGALLFALGGSVSNKLGFPAGDVVARVVQHHGRPDWRGALLND